MRLGVGLPAASLVLLLAEGTSPDVQAYCSGAVSSAQCEGCRSHVDETDIQ